MEQNQTIMKLAKNIQRLAGKALTVYKWEFDEIVGSRCREKYRIERALDGMLDFCFDESMLEMYRKLCRYYYDIDQNTAVEYVYAYREMWDSEKSVRTSKSRKNCKVLRNLQGIKYDTDDSNSRNISISRKYLSEKC